MLIEIPDRSAEKMHLLSDWNLLRELDSFKAVILSTCMNAKAGKVPLPSKGYLCLPRDGRLKLTVRTVKNTDRNDASEPSGAILRTEGRHL